MSIICFQNTKLLKMPVFDPDKGLEMKQKEYCGTCRYFGFPSGRRGYICKNPERQGDITKTEFVDGCDLWKATAPTWKDK